MSGRELEYVRQAFESNFIAPVGPQLTQFEKLFCELTGFAACVAVSSGTAAMHLALRNLGVGPGDVVLASTLTFIGSVSPIVYQGANAVFVDSCPRSWNMDPQLLEQEIERLDREGIRPAAVVPTELYGQCCDVDAISRICDRHQIPLVIDSAESLGGNYGDQHAGHGGQAAIFSFNGNKILTTSGGGVLASNDPEFVARCRYFATQARQPVKHYEHEDVGYNYRMSNVVAAIGIGQLEVLDERVRRKREIAEIYQQRLASQAGLRLMPEADYGKCTRWLTVVTVAAEEFGVAPAEIIEHLEMKNIEARPVWKPMHQQPAFATSRRVGGAVAERLFATGICLPSGTAMRDEQVHEICDLILSMR